MSNNQILGQWGEDRAAHYLISADFSIIERNWRHKHLEVDIIASKVGILHFVEVKTRSSDVFGQPEENVSKSKINSLMKAAEEYLYLYPEWKRIQIDIISVKINTKRQATFYFIEDVYIWD